MPLGRKVGLDPSDIVLDGDTVPPPLTYNVFNGTLKPTQSINPPKTDRAPNFCRCLLWPNGYMDQDATWHGCMPRPRPRCAIDGDPAHSPQKRAQPPPNFRPMCCGQTAGWINMPIGTMVGNGPGNIVHVDADPARPTRGTVPKFRPMSVVAKRLDESRCHLVRRKASAQAALCYMGTQPPPKRDTAPNFRTMSILWPNGHPSQLPLIQGRRSSETAYS